MDVKSMDDPILFKDQDSSTNMSLIQRKRSASPQSSCTSKMDVKSMDDPILFKDQDSSTNMSVSKSSDSQSRRMSLESDRSMNPPIQFSDEKHSLAVSDQTKKSERTKLKELESIFKDLEDKLFSLVKKELKRYIRLLRSEYPHCFEREEKEEEILSSAKEGVLKTTLNILRNMKHTDLANTLQTKLAPVYQKKLKFKLIEKCERIKEDNSHHEKSTLLNEIFTELYITEGGSGEVNKEHEVRQIETASRRPATQEKPINCNDLFKDKSIRTVLTKGVAGIGKTVSVQKFILDWAKGKANQDIHFIFPLPFRELNLIKDKKISLMELLYSFFPEMKELRSLDSDAHKVIMIFDGLDECRLSLDFQNTVKLWDVTEPASVDVLLTNLIKGNLLSSALLWITSRPVAANQIPPAHVDLVTDIRGFTDPQKEEYFRKRISDQSLANNIIKHVKSSRSLYIMCHIPVFCWITTTVLERVLGEAEAGEIPKTLTQMFTHFLIVQMTRKNFNLTQTREMILALGKLAFQQLEKGDLIFYEEDLRECGIDVTDVSVYSGVCTQIFREEFGLHLRKVFSFVHLSVQEFLAAVYTFLTFFSRDEEQLITDLCGIFKQCKMSDFLKSAVDKALQSENGHLDLFLRFLLGLSLKSNQILLQGLLTETALHNKEETVEYIKEKIKENPSPEKSINLFHCLNELNDHSLLQEVQTYVNRTDCSLSGAELSPAQWSALVFVLLNSEEELDVFELKKYDPSNKHLHRLLPVIRSSRRALLHDCNLTEESCEALASALSSKCTGLRELDLSNNKLLDSGIKLLSAGLENSHCKLEKLNLCNCSITYEGCICLASVLKSKLSHLRELNLNSNNPGEVGVTLLSDLLKEPQCKLEILQLCKCNLTQKSCAALVSALSSNSSSLRELNLSNNEQLQDSGVKLLCDGLKNPLCKLEKLGLCNCKISEEGFSALVSALKSNPSHMRELNLSYNTFGESVVKLFHDLLENPHCKLEKLKLHYCKLTKKHCAALASSLRLNSSSLTELDLSYNKISDSGVKALSAGLEHPNSKLKKLVLCECSLTEKSCAALASALSSNSSTLQELDLSYNKLQDSGVKLLSAGLMKSCCELEKLNLSNCSISDEGCAALISALKSNPSHLTELNLNNNKQGESATKTMLGLLQAPQYKLKKLHIRTQHMCV